MPKIICGFPGIGKSTLFNSGLNCTDSDSSKFPKDDFPNNYIQHIKSLIKKDEHEYIFVSSHDSVRSALVEEGIPFTLVYPSIGLKKEYLERYKERGSPPEFITAMDRFWTTFIVGCSEQPHCNRIVLKDGQYLSDVMHRV